MNWDDYFCDIAATVASKSHDPNTQIGAVITSIDHSILSTGYNGFPREIQDTDHRWERPMKYMYLVHAEHNAILNAARTGVALWGSVLYLYGMGPATVPCSQCAKAIIQAGILRVVGRGYKPVPDHWLDDFAFSQRMLDEAGINCYENRVPHTSLEVS